MSLYDDKIQMLVGRDREFAARLVGGDTFTTEDAVEELGYSRHNNAVSNALRRIESVGIPVVRQRQYIKDLGCNSAGNMRRLPDAIMLGGQNLGVDETYTRERLSYSTTCGDTIAHRTSLIAGVRVTDRRWARITGGCRIAVSKAREALEEIRRSA